MAEKTLTIPDIGDFTDVEVIEVLVSDGDSINVEDSLITLETDKATMDIPATDTGVVKQMLIKVGDKVNQGDALAVVEVDEVATSPAAEAAPAEKETPPPASIPAKQEARPVPPPAPVSTPASTKINEVSFTKAYASPSVRKFARELGVDLGHVPGSGRKGRIIKPDVKAFVKQVMAGALPTGGGMQVEPMPEIDFSEFGAIEQQALSKINKLTGKFLHRNWVTVPHVTQFDEADITDLEALRKPMDSDYKEKGIRITLLAFLMKAVVQAMQEYPRFNSSLDNQGENLILKKYFHIGVAVDTPDGLVVPVVRDVDQLSVIDIGTQLGEISAKARDKKLRPTDMQGGCFTISSLGGIGGTAFTPIVNAPEVAILGVSRSAMKPMWNGKEFKPRLMLPLALSYDHRVIDGADGVRFTTHLKTILQDAQTLMDSAS